MGSRKRNSKKKAPESRWQSLLKKPWIFAGAAFGLDLNEFNVSDDRYKISWAAENTLTVGFEDGANYRQLTIPIDRSRIEE